MDSDSSNCSKISSLGEDEKTKKILKLKSSNQKLKMINADLKSKNEALQKQYESAIRIKTDLQEEFDKHNRTVKELIAVRAEKEELEGRLKMCLQTNDDLSFHIGNITGVNSPVSFAKGGLKMHNLNSIGDNSFVNGRREKEIQDLINIASRYFSTNFDSISSLKRFLLNSRDFDLSNKSPINETRNDYQNTGQIDSFGITGSPNENQNESTELSFVRNDRDKMMNLLDRSNNLTTNLESQLKRAKEEIENVKKENLELTKKVQILSTSNDKIEATIPDSVFASPEYPLDLERMVSGIYKNPNLQLPTKIRQVISVIIHFYTNRTEQIEKELKEYKESNYQMKEKTNSLIAFLHHLIPSPNVNYNAILDDDMARNALKESVQHLRNELKSVTEDRDKLEEEKQGLLNKMKTNSIQDATRAFSDLKNKNKELKRFKKESAEKENVYQKKISELEFERTNMKNNLQLLNDNIERQKLEFSTQLKVQETSTKQEIERMKSSHMESIQKLEDEIEKQKNKEKEMHDKYQNDIEKINRDHSTEKSQIEEKYRNEIAELTSNYKQKKNAAKEKYSKDIEQIKAESNNAIEEMKQKYDQNMEEATQKHANDMNEYMQKCSKEKEEYQKKFSEEYAKEEKLLITTTEELEKLKVEHDSLEIELKRVTDEFEKEKKLHLDDKNSLITTIEKLKGKKLRREKEIETLKQQKTQNEEDYEKKSKRQKEELNKRIDDIQQLRSKECKDYAQNIDKLQKEIDTLNSENDKLLISNSEMKISIQRLETKINAIQSEREREKNEYESRIIAQRLASETEMRKQIEEIKQAADLSKRRAYETIIRELSPLSDSHAKYTESNLNQLIQTIRQRFDRLTTAETKIRTIMSLNNFESIEDAIAKRFSKSSRYSRREY